MSWQGERNTVVREQSVEIQQKYYEYMNLRWCPLKSWITSEMPEESIQKLISMHTKLTSIHTLGQLKYFGQRTDIS